MINLQPYEENTFDFYKTLVQACRARKNRENFRDDMIALNPNQKQNFEHYDQSFAIDELQSLTPYQYTEQQRSDLKSLYSYRKKQIESLRIILTKHPLDSRRLINTCQNCTISEVDTLDHIVPKEEFAEFSVHPKNLFPCCTKCNRMKNDIWRTNDGHRVFLNLFIDSLPQQQYLFVEFNQNWIPKFFIENTGNVDPDLFSLIESHFTKLDLLNRFRQSSSKVISRLAADIRSQPLQHSPDIIQDVIKRRCEDQKPIIGFNHWELILEEALGKEDMFIQDCTNRVI
jgi:5-methylcytosine-specific restriction endonuclease McrA